MFVLFDLLGVHVEGGGLTEAVIGEETLITLTLLDDLHQYKHVVMHVHKYGPTGIFNGICIIHVHK